MEVQMNVFILSLGSSQKSLSLDVLLQLALAALKEQIGLVLQYVRPLHILMSTHKQIGLCGV